MFYPLSHQSLVMSETHSLFANLSFSGKTDEGMLREKNEDSFYIDAQGRFCLIADGMGGHAGGKEASQIAVEQIRRYLDENWDTDISSSAMLKAAFLHANQSILDDQEIHREREGMGTTAIAVIFRHGTTWYSHVGDSRLYRYRDGCLEQISEDHTLIARSLRIGDITPQQAEMSPWRHILYQCLGRPDLPHIELASLEMKSGDRLLLCSDGLTEEIPDFDIQKMLSSKNSEDDIADLLIESAKENGGSDNITVIVVNGFEESSPSKV